MALISIAIHDTPENGRDEMTRQTLESLISSVNWKKHRVFFGVNASTEKTRKAITRFFAGLPEPAKSASGIFYLPENRGTAKAVNKGWEMRKPGEHCVKMDNDVVIHSTTWLDEMEEAIFRMPTRIGILGLKRKDCWEEPKNVNPFYRSALEMLPHEPGEPWIVVERVNHVIGTCQLYNSALLDIIGYLYQPGLYGWDDVLAAIRCQVAGFENFFLPHIRIDHIDPGGTEYQGWKEKSSWADRAEYERLKSGYIDGKISIKYSA